MGVVYKAKDTTLGRTVAIKILKPELVRDEQGFERFKREAKAIAGLSHSNIISLYDFGTQDDIHFAVMEFVQGEPLESCIDTLNTETVLGLASGIAKGLSAAHEGGIVHRDIKPSNIIINERFPRQQYWDEIIRRTGCRGFHYLDNPVTKTLFPPDGSHLMPDQAKIFTRELARFVHNR